MEEALRGHGIPLFAIVPRGIGLVVLILIATLAAPVYGVIAIAIGFSISQLVVFLLFVMMILHTLIIAR